MSRQLSVALVVLAASVTASAMSQGVVPAATERFEVATIRPNKTPIEGSLQRGGIQFLAGRFQGTQLTLQELVMFAYELQAFEIFGGPGWATSDRFDIAATMPPPPTGSDPRDAPARNRRMIRALLAERFQLVVHEERREVPVYVLVPARTDRKLGARLRPFEGECGDPSTLGPLPESPTGPLPTSDRSKGPQRCMSFVGVGRLSARGMSLSDLTRMLAPFAAIRRRVIDRTGLTGQFDYDLEWTPIAAPTGVPASAVPGASSDGPPNIFTALQEQLGLKLESTKEVIPVLVIDSVNQPSPD